MRILKWIAIVMVGFIIWFFLFPDLKKTTTTEAVKTDLPKETTTSTTTTEPIKTVSENDIQVIKSSETIANNMSTIHVELKNNTEELLTTGQIKIVYEDDKGNIVGTGVGTILNLAAGATKVVDCLAMDIVGASTYRVEVTPMIYE